MLRTRRSIVTCLCVAVLTIILTGISFAGPQTSRTFKALNEVPIKEKRDATKPAPLGHILETCLYIRNMNASIKFYRDVLGLNGFMITNKLSAFALGSTTLLLFHLGETSQDLNYKGTQGSPGSGQIAGHGPDTTITNFLGLVNKTGAPQDLTNHPEVSLKLHYAFAVDKRDEVLKWEEHLKKENVHIHSTMEWERGGRSVYFFDPDGHVGEIVSRGIWPHW